MISRLLTVPFVILGGALAQSWACTSAIVGSKASIDGSPMIWKHRDTSHSKNYIDTVSATDSSYGYLALFNSEDTVKAEAWGGVNERGFAIINTVAGNLPPNSNDCIDREGIVMSEALRHCMTVDDFQRLLDSLPKPLGVRTNFGVLDAQGRGAYFETDDYKYVKHSLDTAECGYLVRSNFSCSAPPKGGYGHERYHHALAGIMAAAEEEGIAPELFTETLSREYFDSYKGVNALDTTKKKVKDNNYIPRPTSASSIVIVLTPEGPVMWTMLGYPPAAETRPATLTSVADEQRLDPTIGNSRDSDRANRLKKQILSGGYINVEAARRISDEMLMKSLKNYDEFTTLR